MSFTSTVPAAVPSLFHNSMPLTPSSAVKYVVEPIAAICDGFADSEFVLMSRTICGVKDGVRRFSSVSRPRRCCRDLGREIGTVGLARRIDWHQRRQNEVFMRWFSID